MCLLILIISIHSNHVCHYESEEDKYDERLKAIKRGELESGKIETMTIIIKATDNSNYLNLIDALDEMQICSVGKYVIDKINDNDKKLLEAAGVKE